MKPSQIRQLARARFMFRTISTAICALVLSVTTAVACDGRLIDDDRFFGAPLCVPERPQRVVVLDQSFSLGIGMELGLPIIGAPLTRISDENLLQKAQDAGIEDLGFVTKPNLERIVALQPDLIVGFTGNPGLAESVYPML